MSFLVIVETVAVGWVECVVVVSFPGLFDSVVGVVDAAAWA